MARAGWYPDPRGGGLRWWDSAAWTDDTMGGAATASTPTISPSATVEAPPPPLRRARQRPQRGPSWLAPVIIGVGLVLLVVGAVSFVPRIADQFGGPRIPLPEGRTVALDDGEWLLSQRVDSSRRLRATDLRVMATTDVRLEGIGGLAATTTIGSTTYEGFARLFVDGRGEVTIGVAAAGEPSSLRTELLVTRGVGALFAALGFLALAIVGLVLAILGQVRRRRDRAWQESISEVPTSG